MCGRWGCVGGGDVWEMGICMRGGDVWEEGYVEDGICVDCSSIWCDVGVAYS